MSGIRCNMSCVGQIGEASPWNFLKFYFYSFVASDIFLLVCFISHKIGHFSESKTGCMVVLTDSQKYKGNYMHNEVN